MHILQAAGHVFLLPLHAATDARLMAVTLGHDSPWGLSDVTHMIEGGR